MARERETFGSRFGSVMALMGVAVGLANVWRFPYMAGSYGGAAFVLMYIFFGIVLGIPAVMAEWTLGRFTRQGPAGAFVTAGMPGGRAIGMMLFFTVFMANSYYTLVVGQVLFYALETSFVGEAGANPEGYFETMLTGITVWNVSVTATAFAGVGTVLYFGVAASKRSPASWCRSFSSHFSPSSRAPSPFPERLKAFASFSCPTFRN